MTRYILAAATHEETGGRLLSGMSSAIFRERITPLLTDHSLILLEGDYYEGSVAKGHPRYDACSADIAQVLGTARPTLMGIDPRFRDRSKVRHTRALNELWLNYAVEASIEEGWKLPAATLEELMTYLKQSPKHPELAVEITGPMRNTAQWVHTMTRRFDRTYIELMRRKGPHHDVCVLIAGASHCISIGIKTEYEIIRLARTSEPSELLWDYLAYLANCVWAGDVLRKGAAA